MHVLRNSLSVISVCASLATSCAMAAGESHDLPRPVADWLDHARQDCVGGGFRSEGAVQSTSLSGDGRPGYIIDPHHLICASSPNLYGGLGPASIELFVTLPSGQVIHAGGILGLGYRVTPSAEGGPPLIALETHEVTERAGSSDFYRWDGQSFTMINRRSLALPPDE